MSFLTYDTADDIILSLEIIEKLFFPETDFWHDNYPNLIFTGFVYHFHYGKYLLFTADFTQILHKEK